MAAYDVFISHCGVDSKRNSAIFLKEELERVGLRCFFDDASLEVGDKAADKMLEAMENARFGIVILSPGFYTREWCVKELQTFVRKGNAVPIYFPAYSDVEMAKNEAIAKKVWTTFKKSKLSEEEYLEAVGLSITGLDVLSVDGWWNVCIRQARDVLLKLLRKIGGGPLLSEDELLVGQHEQLRELKELLGLPKQGASASIVAAAGAMSEEVGIVGVKGMGGVGKSTLAKKLYDDPEVRAFFGDNVCWAWVGQNPSEAKICAIQREIIRKFCDQKEDIIDPTVGRALIRKRLQDKKVLICLDDVWANAEMVATSVVRLEDLHAGSRILKTSRVKAAIGGHVFDMDILEKGPAWELFCWHAFNGQKPPGVLVGLANEAAERCNGLPLALKLLGRQLAGVEDKKKKKSLDEFLSLGRYHDAMVSCRTVIWSSYENLPSHPPGLQDAFVLMGGLWPASKEFTLLGRARQNIGAAVYGDYEVGLRRQMSKNAIKQLCDRSLIKLERRDDGKYVTIHDILLKFASEVVSERTKFGHVQEGTNSEQDSSSSCQHIRVSTSRVPIGCLTSPAVQSLVVEAGMQWTRRQGLFPWFTGTSSCRLLSIQARQVFKLPALKNLQCLRLISCKLLERLPDGIESFECLVVLEIRDCYARGTLPAEWARLTRLECLDLGGNQLSGLALPLNWRSLSTLNLQANDITHLRTLSATLTSLDLSECKSLTTVPNLTGCRALTLLNMRGCGSLAAAKKLSQCAALTSLDLSRCYSLAAAPDLSGCATLTSLNQSVCSRLTTAPDLSGCVALTTLSLRGCGKLAAAPNVSRCAALTSLDLEKCESLTAVPNLSGCAALASLILRECRSLAAAPNMSGCAALTSLDLQLCKSLAATPDLSGCGALTSLNMRGCGSLAGAPNLSKCTALMTLDLEGCESLTAMPDMSGCAALTSLFLRGCGSLAVAPNMSGFAALTSLDLQWCKSLAVTPDLSRCRALTSLNMRGCGSLAAAPKLSGCAALTLLDSQWCQSLVAAPDLSGCGALMSLNMRGCGSLAAVSNLSKCTALTSLDLSTCCSLAAAPNLSGCAALTSLNLSGCWRLAAAPDLSGCVALTSLNLSMCSSLAAPPDLSGCTALTALNLRDCKSLAVTPDLSGCTALRDLHV